MKRCLFLNRHNLLSQAASHLVSSAQMSLTTVFGKGTGGTSSYYTPANALPPLLERKSKRAGIHLLYQDAAVQVSSAQMSLTTVFGKGTGGTSSQSTPAEEKGMVTRTGFEPMLTA